MCHSEEDLIKNIKAGPGKLIFTPTPLPKISLWNTLKHEGNPAYKTGTVEPIDLYKASGMFTPFALCSIIKYAYRLPKTRQRDKAKTLDKIIHYAQLLKAALEEEKT